LRPIPTQLFAEIGTRIVAFASPEIHMAHRSAKFASTVLAVAVAGTIFSALPRDVANAAECVSEPKDQTPQRNKHWYYRIERGSGRHCWYLREESERSSPAASTSSPALEKADSRKAENTAPHSIADARAELTLPQTRIDHDSAPPPAQPIWPKLAAAGNDQHVNAGDVFTQQSSISSRWPESSGEKPPARPQPAEQLVADAGPDPVATPSPRAAAPVGPGRTDVQPGRASGSVQMLLLVILGALALAGLTGSIVFRLGGRPRSNSIRGSRRVVWETAERPVLELEDEDDMPTQWADTDQPPPEYTRGGALQPNDSDERIDMITEFLERMSKQVRADADAISAADSASRAQKLTGQPAVRVLVAPREEPT
jgi:hypothetical protein